MFSGGDKRIFYAHRAKATKLEPPCAGPFSYCGTNAIDSYLFDLLGQDATSTAAKRNPVLWEVGDASISRWMTQLLNTSRINSIAP
jgi:hypothetical protein